MILNKSAYERGFGHASVYKNITVDLREEARMGNNLSSGDGSGGHTLRFGNTVRYNKKEDTWGYKHLSAEGAPLIGDPVKYGDPIWCTVDQLTNKDRAGNHKENEQAYIQAVRMIGDENGKAADNKLSITLRFPRNPVIGDKFSSRHGQKGGR